MKNSTGLDGLQIILLDVKKKKKANLIQSILKIKNKEIFPDCFVGNK